MCLFECVFFKSFDLRSGSGLVFPWPGGDDFDGDDDDDDDEDDDDDDNDDDDDYDDDVVF